MGVRLDFHVDTRQLAGLEARRIERAAARAMRKAAATGLRDMRSEGSKRVRARKRVKAGIVRRSLHLRRPNSSSLDGIEFGLDVAGTPQKVSDYPHRQTRAGVTAEINRGRRSLLKSAFVATMASGHTGVFLRRGAARLPIYEPHASRVVDALLHAGEAEGVAERSRRSVVSAFERLFAMELEKESRETTEWPGI